MKKLLMKWFPNYFHVCVHKEVKFEDIKRDNALNLAIVDPDSDQIHRVLGIPDDRAELLAKRAKGMLLMHDKYTAALEAVSREHCKHINELVWCITTMEGERNGGGHNPLGGLLGAIMLGPNGPIKPGQAPE
jgi:hypothetical protein